MTDRPIGLGWRFSWIRWLTRTMASRLLLPGRLAGLVVGQLSLLDRDVCLSPGCCAPRDREGGWAAGRARHGAFCLLTRITTQRMSRVYAGRSETGWVVKHRLDLWTMDDDDDCGVWTDRASIMNVLRIARAMKRNVGCWYSYQRGACEATFHLRLGRAGQGKGSATGSSRHGKRMGNRRVGL